MSKAYYNENDPRAAAWLRELIKESHIAPGDVDDRSIEDVTPNDLAGYKQCHFFAGIGGWSLALRMVGWPDDRAAWTGSCPCQPFSLAGARRGFNDSRHLWPVWFNLIQQCEPAVLFGEQVASKAGLGWLDVVFADLENQMYSCAAADLCAAGVGAPHVRQRLYWMAHYGGEGRRQVSSDTAPGRKGGEEEGLEQRFMHGGTFELDIAASCRREGFRNQSTHSESLSASAAPSVLGHAGQERQQQYTERDSQPCRGITAPCGSDVSRSSGWAECEWVACRDGKSRPVEPGTFPLAHGVPGRVGLLRGYGNAIVPQLAAAFIEATGLV